MCLAGEQCGGTLLPKASGGQAPPPYAHGVGSYFGLYGTGQFDGQNSGHDYMGTVRRVLCCVVSVRPCSGHAPARVGVRQEHRERVGDPKHSFLQIRGACAAVHAPDRLCQQLRRRPLPYLLRLPPAVICETILQLLVSLGSEARGHVLQGLAMPCASWSVIFRDLGPDA